MTRKTPILLAALLVTLLSACMTYSQNQAQAKQILLATTTSTYDSGLLDHILPVFEEQYNTVVKVIPVGTGQAIELGKRGDADIILVHATPDEKLFVSEGYGIERHCVMYNDFVILGPESDPAEIEGTSATEALKKIANSGSTFVSRGDNSGTHKKELAIWQLGGVEDKGSGYIETGTSMGLTLLTASEKGVYTLSDRATFVAMKNQLALTILSSGDPMLLNPYGIIAVNPQKTPVVNTEGAEKLVRWITGDEAQALIKDFTKNGERLFTPLHDICFEEES